MHEMYPKVNEAEIEFLVKLDAELEKVDSFYLKREKEVKEMCEVSSHLDAQFSCLTSYDRLAKLKEQLQEFKDHQKSFQVFCPTLYGLTLIVNLRSAIQG